MGKTILITGATDGIGFETAKLLARDGNELLLHGRNPDKLSRVVESIGASEGSASIASFVADLSRLAEVERFASDVTERCSKLDVLINNAGVFKTSQSTTPEGFDVRFIVNTIAPFLITQRLLPLMDTSGRIINLSSAAQSPVDLKAMAGGVRLADMEAYAQSKLALTMWSRHLALSVDGKGPVIVAVNPGSLLATKMVKEGFGVAGSDIRIGADILVRAALSDEFADAYGKYYDNDARGFGSPHPEALNEEKNAKVVRAIGAIISAN